MSVLPGVLVHRDLRSLRLRGIPGSRSRDGLSRSNPYANRGSRVARWMLIHPEQTFSPTALADVVGLDPAAVSRLLTALEDTAVVRPAGLASSAWAAAARSLDVSAGIA